MKIFVAQIPAVPAGDDDNVLITIPLSLDLSSYYLIDL